MPDNYVTNVEQDALLLDWQTEFASLLFEQPDQGEQRDLGFPGRMAIYRNNVFSSLITALEDTFPVIKQLVGDTCFRHLAFQYVCEHKPGSVVLANYGDTFADFLLSQDSLQELAYLPDMARFERLYIDTYHSADHPSMDQAGLATALKQPDLLPLSGVCFHPSFHLFKSLYAVVSLWSFHQEGSSSERLQIQTREHAFLCRVQGQVIIVKLFERDSEAIELLMHGYSLGEVVEHITEYDENWSIEPLLKNLFYYQCITEIHRNNHKGG